MKCKLAELWHTSPETCDCVNNLHKYKDKWCICLSHRYCDDAWKIVDQEKAKKLLIGKSYVFQQLEEWFEYV